MVVLFLIDAHGDARLCMGCALEDSAHMRNRTSGEPSWDWARTLLPTYEPGLLLLWRGIRCLIGKVSLLCLVRCWIVVIKRVF